MTKKDKRKKCSICGKISRDRNAWLRHRRRRHPEAVQKAKESSNKQKYGQTAKEYDEQLKSQNDLCAVCGRPKKNVGLHQDHTHKIAKLKIKVLRTKSTKHSKAVKWRAYNEEFDFVYYSRSKKKAVREVRNKLRRESRRGILCWSCNSGLRKWLDNPRRLRNAACYLEYWQKKQGWNYIKNERVR